MFKFFYKKAENIDKKPIYEEILNSLKDPEYRLEFIEHYSLPGFGEYEYNILTGKEDKNLREADELLNLITKFKSDEKEIENIDKYLKDKRALELINSFEYLYFRFNTYEEDALIGVATKLMKLGSNVETVKLGILLTQYFDLESKSEAKKVVFQLGEYPDFTYYSLLALKPTNMYYGALEDYLKTTFDYGELIVREMEGKDGTR
mgnify:CR=1 FL=1